MSLRSRGSREFKSGVFVGVRSRTAVERSIGPGWATPMSADPRPKENRTTHALPDVGYKQRANCGSGVEVPLKEKAELNLRD